MYLPRINKALAEFKSGWNNHNIRTAHGKTPNQLYTEDVLALQQSGLTTVDFFNSADDTYGIDEEGLSSTTSVPVPAVRFQLTDEYYADLVQSIVQE